MYIEKITRSPSLSAVPPSLLGRETAHRVGLGALDGKLGRKKKKERKKRAAFSAQLEQTSDPQKRAELEAAIARSLRKSKRATKKQKKKAKLRKTFKKVAGAAAIGYGAYAFGPKLLSAGGQLLKSGASAIPGMLPGAAPSNEPYAQGPDYAPQVYTPPTPVYAPSTYAPSEEYEQSAPEDEPKKSPWLLPVIALGAVALIAFNK